MNAAGSSANIGIDTGAYVGYADPSVVYLTNPLYGAELNGSNDDAALNAAQNATPIGGVLVLPPALIGFSTWVPRPDINYRGAGYFCLVNAPFGNAQWATANYGRAGYFGGTVLAQTGTQGLTIQNASANTAGGCFDGIMVLGTGAGNVTGFQLGGANFVAPYAMDQVMVANFANPYLFDDVEDGTFIGVRARGFSGTGYTDNARTNNNTFVNFEAQEGPNGLAISGQGNQFAGPLLQFLTAQPLLLSGTGNTLETPWLENAGAATRAAVSGSQNTIINPRAGAANDVLSISGSDNLLLCSVGDGPAAFAVSGNNNLLIGTFASAPVITGVGNYWLSPTELLVGLIKGIGGTLAIGATSDAADLLLQLGDGKDTNLRLMRGGVEYINLLAAAGGGSGLNNEYTLDIVTFGAASRPLLIRQNIDGTITQQAAFPASGGIQIQSGATLTSGAGAPTASGTAGDRYYRTDTPGTLGQREYICTGGTSWTALAT